MTSAQRLAGAPRRGREHKWREHKWLERLGAAMIALLCSVASAAACAQLVADLAAPGEALRIVTTSVDVLTPDGDGFVPVKFLPADQPVMELKADAAGWNLGAAGEIRMHLQNAMPWPVTVDIRLSDLSGGTLDARLGLAPGGPLTLSVPLQATHPRRWGMMEGPPIPWLQDSAPVAVALTTVGKVDASRLAAVRIAMPRPAAPQTLRIGKIFVEPRPVPDYQERLAYTGIVDAYGQYTRGDWEEKYRPDAHQGKPGNTDVQHKAHPADHTAFARFAASKEAEPEPVNRIERGARLDDYGGLLDMGLQAITSLPLARASLGAARTSSGTTAASASSPAVSPAFFRTTRVGANGKGRWLLLTPSGNPFFSLGVNAIQLNNSQTFVEGREFMFTALPEAADPLARFSGRQDSADDLPLNAGAQRGRGYSRGATFDFYRANLYRRDGEDFARQWLARTRDRLVRWNFNTIASWSDAAVSSGARIPYTRTIHIGGDFGRLSDGQDWWAGIPDVFDPRFRQALDRAFEREAKPLKDDPFLIGYFVDNELGWGNGTTPDPLARYALAYSAMRADARVATTPGAHAKRAMLDLLRERHEGSIERLAAAWKKPLRSWASLEGPLAASELPDGHLPEVAADLAAFLHLHAERYFAQVAASLDRHDPNHLYLGARFASRTPEALDACARWCDVMSFNLYLPTLDAGFDAEGLRRLDKPALLTEFHFGSRDRGPFWPGLVPVPSEADRGAAYDRFLKSVLANPEFVGAHWFQYLDQAVTGRWLDGENGHLGLVAITDIPWNGFVSEVRRTNRQVRESLREQLKTRR